MGLGEIKEAVDRRYPNWPRRERLELIKELRDREAAANRSGEPFSLAEELGTQDEQVAGPKSAARVVPQEPWLRADETAKKQGLTFGDLCALVDKGRELGVDPTTVVLGDYWISNKVPNRAGYRARWMEI